MAVVVFVCCVVNGVETGAHYRPHIAVNTVVNVRRPNPLYEKEHQVCRELHWNYKQSYHVRYSLQYPVQWVKRQTGKRRESVLLVVDVMSGVQIFIERLYVVQLSVHPIDIKLHKHEIDRQIRDVHYGTNIAHPRKAPRPTLLDHVL